MHKLDLMGHYRVISVPTNQGSLGCGADSGCRAASSRINIIYLEIRGQHQVFIIPLSTRSSSLIVQLSFLVRILTHGDSLIIAIFNRRVTLLSVTRTVLINTSFRSGSIHQSSALDLKTPSQYRALPRKSPTGIRYCFIQCRDL